MTEYEENNTTDSVEPYETEPLTDWENEPEVVDLKKDLEEATPHHDTHVNKVNTWLDNLNVTGSAKISKVKGRSQHVAKLIRKQAEWRYAALSESFLSDEDIYNADPVTWEDKKAAEQNQLVLNNQFNTKLNKTAFIDEYVRAAVDEGTVITRVGWDFKEKEVEVPNMVVQRVEDPRLIQIIQEAMATVVQNPEAVEEIPTELMEIVNLSGEMGYPAQLVQDGTKLETQIVKNQPTVEVCDYNSVIVDPTCKGDISKANFVIYQFETSLSDLRKDGIYKNLDNIKVERSAIQNEPAYGQEDTSSFNFTDEPRKKFVAYEYWGYWDKDGSGKTEPIVGTWVGDTLIRMEDSPFPDEGLPFVLVQYLPKRKNVYGEPDGELLEENQKIASAVTRGMLDIMGRSAAGQTGVRKDALDVTNQRKYDLGMDYMFNAHIDPRAAFHSHVYPEIPNSAQFMLQLQNNEAEALTGVKAFHGGISGEGLGKSATAARSALDAASKRELGILRRLAQGIIEIGRKITSMNAIFLSDEEIIRITNEEFVTVKKDDLAGRIDIKLSISTVETDNAKAQELAFMLQTMGNSMPMEMSQLILADIAKLRKMPQLAKNIQEFRPEPDPIEQRLKELQVEREEAEIKKLNSEAEENMAEAQLDLAKARDASSSADKKDLDYVEQEEGVTHARNLQQDGAQAEANLRRDLFNASLKGGKEAS